MTHDFIAAHDVIARYAANRLPAGEERDFEAHLVDCAQCADEVEQELALRDGLAASAADRPTAPMATAHAQRSIGHVGWWQAAAAVLAIATIGLALLFTNTRSALQVVDNERNAQQQRADEAARAAQSLESRVAELESRIAAPPAQGSDAPRTFSDALMPTTVFALTAVRGSSSVDTFTLDRRVPAPIVVLTVDVPPGEYAVTLKDRDGRPVWSGGQFRPSAQDVMAIGIERRVLADGRYTLEVQGRDAAGQTTMTARYPFEIVSK